IAALGTDVVVLGFGRVGRALADQVAAVSGGPRVRVVGLLDRSGFVFDPRGLSRRRLLDLARREDSGAPLASPGRRPRARGAGALVASLGGRRAAGVEALTFMADHAVSRPVLVDVTSDDTAPVLEQALGHGFDLVLANKKPLAASAAAYQRLMSASSKAGRD